MRDPHIVPLSRQAQAVLRQAKPLRTSAAPDALLFPGFSRGGALSENDLLALLARPATSDARPRTVSAHRFRPGRMRSARAIRM